MSALARIRTFWRPRNGRLGTDYYLTDPIFRQFEPWSGRVKAGFRAGFLGEMVDDRFDSVGQFGGSPARDHDHYAKSTYPALTQDIYEWQALLSAVLESGDRFVMIEAGAGFGRWLVSAACALRRKRPEVSYCLVGIEAEPVHFAWMEEHFRNNGLDPTAHRLLNAAVSAEDGVAELLMNDNSSGWYGQTITSTHHGRYAASDEQYRHVSVPSLSLGTLLSDLARVDFLHVDIQGAEEQAIFAGIDVMSRKVRRTLIATHAPHIDTLLSELFSSHGWRCVHQYPCEATSRTEFGDMAFVDGVQHWVNPRLLG